MTTSTRPAYPAFTLFAVAFILTETGSYLLLRRGGFPTAQCWLGLSAAMGAHVLLATRRHLSENRSRTNTPLYPTLGAANGITLARGLVLALMTGFLCPGYHPYIIRWIPAILYSIAAAADYLDGYVARRTGRVSLLGAWLDMHLDSIGVLVASALAVRYGQLPLWYLTVGLARYLFLAGTWLLRRAGRPVLPLPDSVMRRTMAGLEMGFLAAALFPLFTAPVVTLVGTLFFIPFMGGFARDFLHVAGWLPPARLDRFQPLMDRLPAYGRWLAAGLLIGSAFRSCADPSQCVHLLILSGLLLLGILPRLSAVGLLLDVGLSASHTGLDETTVLLLICGTLVLFWGGGLSCLWAPDDALIGRKAGGSRS